MCFNRMMKNILTLLLLLALTSCAIGPLALNETARSTGAGHHALSASFGSTDYALKWNYGLSQNLDIGVQVENLSQGIRAKYSLLNQSEGSSVAIAGGTGLSMGGNHHYLDAIYSTRANWFEPYLAYRFMWVNSDSKEFKSSDTDEKILRIDRDNYRYGQFFLGTRLNFSENFYGSIELSSFHSLAEVKVSPELFYNFGLGFKF